jgi:hypothetical protein
MMNWARGLFRAWLLFTACWVFSAAYFHEQELREAWYPTYLVTRESGEKHLLSGLTSENAARLAIENPPLSFDKQSRIEMAPHLPLELSGFLKAALIPPFTLLALFISGRWVIRGF